MSVPYRTNSYGDFLSHFSALVGTDSTTLQATELTFINTFFNRAIRKIWESQVWTDICPYGEVRFPTNVITYPNDLTQSAYWTQNAVTASTGVVTNPLDNRQTASALLETTANAQHGVQQNFTLLPAQPYTFSGYALPSGRNYILVSVLDGSGNPSVNVFFTLTGSGTVGTINNIGTTGAQAALNMQANGWYKWSLSLTTAATAGSGASLNVSLSPDGTTTSYVGTTTLGASLWGNTAYLQQNYLPTAYIIPFGQLGESAIDSVFEVWANNPLSGLMPTRVGYTLSPNGIQLIGSCGPGPLYLYYRPQRPSFSGAVFNAGATYAVGAKMYYTTTAGTLNYYQCLIATSAGQTPDTTPLSWNLIAIPYVFFEYLVYNTYADWLNTEGQTAKSQAMYQYAQSCIDDENDRLERQNGIIQPWRVSTHVTSQNRNMGYQGQNFIPAGSAIAN